ncbi:MAG: hypothetical protein IJ083_00500 [Clostridia bacterium]|nr:hypothetical protein [Clostridia bacterium]
MKNTGNTTVSFLIVGSGYRAEYFGRIAARYPELFRAMYLCRSEEKVDLMRRQTGIGGTILAEEAMDFQPDFVVVAVDRGHMNEVVCLWASRGYPVLAETPVGCSEEELTTLWEMATRNKVVISSLEQYHRYPVIAEGIRRIEAGAIGEPVSMTLSLCHEYHGMSLIRRMLRVQGEDYSLMAMEGHGQAVATDSRYGAIRTGEKGEETRQCVLLRFASGKTAIYDFAPIQYRSFIRGRHVTVRGERGEWHDRFFDVLDERGEPRKLCLMPEIPEAYRALDTQTLRDLRKAFSGEMFLETAWDEFAIATMLMDMKNCLEGGPSPYPLREAMEDAYFPIMVKRALQSGQIVSTPPRPWI